jgi:hypothetical protein
MELEPIEIANGIFSIIFAIISITIGIIIALKYFEYKKRDLLLVGITWIGMVEPWVAASLSFLYTLLTGDMFTTVLYLLIGITFLPITILIWMIAFTDLVYKKNQIVILIIIAIYGALFEIFFLYFIFTKPSILGELISPVDMEYNLFLRIYLLSVLILALITGVLFARKSLRSEKPEIKLKGKFLLAAFISFVIGGILDTIITANFVALLITRIILISSSIEFYYGFILPEWMKKRFLRQK